MAPIELEVWRGSKMCVKRNTKFSYINQHSNCPPAMKVCSKNLCILDAEPCPISTIKPATKEEVTGMSDYEKR